MIERTAYSGILRSIGWETDDVTGKEVFRAIIDYPKGLPDDLPFDAVWKQWPVKIVIQDTQAMTKEPSLAARLRDIAGEWADAEIREEAADEIERLEAESAELRDELKFCLPYVRGAAALFNRARELGRITDKDREYAAEMVDDIEEFINDRPAQIEAGAAWLRKVRYEAVMADRNKKP